MSCFSCNRYTCIPLPVHREYFLICLVDRGRGQSWIQIELATHSSDNQLTSPEVWLLTDKGRCRRLCLTLLADMFCCRSHQGTGKHLHRTVGILQLQHQIDREAHTWVDVLCDLPGYNVCDSDEGWSFWNHEVLPSLIAHWVQYTSVTVTSTGITLCDQMAFRLHNLSN